MLVGERPSGRFRLLRVRSKVFPPRAGVVEEEANRLHITSRNPLYSSRLQRSATTIAFTSGPDI